MSQLLDCHYLQSAARDRYGSLDGSWVTLLHDPDAQVRRWGQQMITPGPWPAAAEHWVYEIASGSWSATTHDVPRGQSAMTPTAPPRSPPSNSASDLRARPPRPPPSTSAASTRPRFRHASRNSASPPPVPPGCGDFDDQAEGAGPAFRHRPARTRLGALDGPPAVATRR